MIVVAIEFEDGQAAECIRRQRRPHGKQRLGRVMASPGAIQPSRHFVVRYFDAVIGFEP